MERGVEDAKLNPANKAQVGKARNLIPAKFSEYTVSELGK